MEINGWHLKSHEISNEFQLLQEISTLFFDRNTISALWNASKIMGNLSMSPF